ncbi:MAG: alkaline phosphatase family protein [Clostridiales bacterium]|jgi:hypothetical protein|nr:alkaline phosphatase family protein [Clostridiales bacterium]
MMKKRILKTVVIIFVAVAVIGGAVYGGIQVSKAAYLNNYLKKLDESGLFENTSQDRIPQNALYSVILNHVRYNESGKTPMLLFIGYDGFLANAVNFTEDSAIQRVAKSGGLYLGYAGGQTIGEQETWTAPGWATFFTGVYADTHKVYDNEYTLSPDVESVIYTFGKSGIETSFSVSWKNHFTVTYKGEIEKASEYNYPIRYALSTDDTGTKNAMKSGIASGERAIFGIFEYTDHAGHSYGFDLKKKEYAAAVQDAESAGNELIDAVYSRENFENEDWLIIITTDHGGYEINHGGFTIPETTIFFAVNKIGCF